mgnify:FL=1
MFLPQFTLRSTMKWVTIAAIFFLVLARAFAGSYWAIALSVAVVSILVVLLVHAAFFVFVVVISKLFRNERLPARTKQGGIQSTTDDRFLAGPRVKPSGN